MMFVVLLEERRLMSVSRPFLGEADGCAGEKRERRFLCEAPGVSHLLCFFPSRTHRHAAGVTRQNTGSGEQSPSARSRHRQPAKSVQHAGMANGTATSTAHSMANGTATGMASSTAHGVANGTATGTAHGMANGTGEHVLWVVGGRHLGLRFLGENEFLLK